METKNTLLQDAFSLFYSTDELRPAMQKPFVVKGKTYATDGTLLIRCDNDKIDFEFENNEKLPNVLAIMPTENMSEIIDIDSVDWASFMNQDETEGDGNDIVCGHCNGEGTYDDDVYYKGKSYDIEYECPVCDGSGYESEENQIPTGNKTFGFNDRVLFKETLFYATRFYKLKKVKDLLGGNLELISYNNNNKAILFRINFVEIIIMPCLSDEEDVIIAKF